RETHPGIRLRDRARERYGDRRGGRAPAAPLRQPRADGGRAQGSARLGRHPLQEFTERGRGYGAQARRLPPRELSEARAVNLRPAALARLCASAAALLFALVPSAADVFAGLCLSLFMFSRAHSVEDVQRERLYLIRLQSAFRNRLPPGQFPYPFWHDEAKWGVYQATNCVLLWVDPKTARIVIR